MTIDVTVERVIPLPPDQVADYAMDWRHDTEWTKEIVETKLTREAEGGGFGVGAEVTRTAQFLGKRMDHVQQVVGYEPPRLLEMETVAGPLPMHVAYTFTPHAHGTLARIRVRGDAGGAYRLAGPVLARKIRSSISHDLRDLERRLC